jgi:hypothetical protein
MIRLLGRARCVARYVEWGGVSQKDIYFFKRRLEAHPISQGGYKVLGESNREKVLATGSGWERARPGDRLLGAGTFLKICYSSVWE